jgi:hypothetical protein
MDSLPGPEPRVPNMSAELTINGRASPSHPVVTFIAYDKATGAELIADDRTFDGATMSLEPVTPEGA